MGKYTIAVVDDEVKMTKLVRLILEDHFDCEVETFNDSMEAYRRFEEKKFDAMILDHRMPKLTGMGLVQMLRSGQGPNRRTRILVMTGYIEEAETLDTDLLDEVIFLEKPVSDDRLVRWMNLLLKGKSPSPRAAG